MSLVALNAMFSDQLVFPLRAHTSPEWAPVILKNFDEFLKDHAGAERKAHANCLSILTKYQDRTELVETMIDVASEELQHFKEVVVMLHRRGLTLAESLLKDVYVEKLLEQMRPKSLPRLLDRLILTSIIEARGCERFGLLGQALEHSGEGVLGNYYTELARVEARHYGTYLRLARHYDVQNSVEQRFDELLEFEGELVKSLPLRPALH